MRSSVATSISSRKSSKRSSDVPALVCRDLVKRFYYYEHRPTTLREVFIRVVLRRPLEIRRPNFSLAAFNLRVEQGEAIALIGPNGSGKSTALRLMAGIYAPTEGTVERCGRISSVIELGAGFHEELTGAENVELYAAILGLSRRELASRFDEMVSFAEIGDFIDTPVKYYSSGMYARLAFSVAVCVEPDIMLLDEILAVGDAEFRQRCLERLQRFHRAGGTLIIASHDLPIVRQLCSRAIWLERGQVKMAGDVNQVLEAYEAETS